MEKGLEADKRTEFGDFILNLKEGEKAILARTLGVSKAAITRWSYPIGHKNHRYPSFCNSLNIHAYLKKIKAPISAAGIIGFNKKKVRLLKEGADFMRELGKN